MVEPARAGNGARSITRTWTRDESLLTLSTCLDGRYERADLSWSRSIQRSAFLAAVDEVEPEVLRDLSRSALATYGAAAEYFAVDGEKVPRHLFLTQRRYLAHMDYLAGFGEGCLPAWKAPFHALRNALDTWSARWHLQAPWCIEAALEAVDIATFSEPPSALTWRISPPIQGVMLAFDADLVQERTFSYMPWLPSGQPRAQAREHLIEAFARHLDAELDSIEQAAKSRGYIRGPVKRQPAHFVWLARHVVKGESYNSIAKSVNKKRPSITQAIEDLGAAIQLPPFWP